MNNKQIETIEAHLGRARYLQAIITETETIIRHLNDEKNYDISLRYCNYCEYPLNSGYGKKVMLPLLIHLFESKHSTTKKEFEDMSEMPFEIEEEN